MKIFASNCFISSLNQDSRGQLIYGSYLADNDLYRNLIRFGKFDEYHFYILPYKPGRGSLPLKKELLPYKDNKRIRFKSLISLPQDLRSLKHTVFFTPNPFLAYLARLRDMHALNCLPVCGIAFTVSYGYLWEEVFWPNLIAGLRPYDSIICISKMVKESIARIQQSLRKNARKSLSVNLQAQPRLEYIPLGINVDDFNKQNKNFVRKQLGLPLNKVVILYFGRFSLYDKADIQPLLIAFRNLSLRFKNIILCLGGNNAQGNYAQKVLDLTLELKIDKSVKFFLNPSGKMKDLLYAASDIFVSPSDSLQESLGLTILEAMASGLPVVASDWDGYKELVTHQKTGFLVPVYWAKCDKEIAGLSGLMRSFETEQYLLSQSVAVDVGKMTHFLGALVANKALRQQLGENARKKVAEEYDWSVLIPKYENFWQRLSVMSKRGEVLTRKNPLFYPEFYKCFNNYPSRIIVGKTKMSITDEGLKVLKTRVFPNRPPHLIDLKIVLLILFMLQKGRSVCLEDIHRHIKMLPENLNIEQINYHIMWMLKKYLLEVRN